MNAMCANCANRNAVVYPTDPGCHSGCLDTRPFEDILDHAASHRARLNHMYEGLDQ